MSREISANGGPKRYRAWRGDVRAIRMMARPRTPKLARNEQLRGEVERLLTQLWSPQQISAHLRATYPGDEGMRVSHETIYQALVRAGTGQPAQGAHRVPADRQGAAAPAGPAEDAGQLTSMVMISERPAEVEDRAVPGRWESQCRCQARVASRQPRACK